MSCSRCPGSFIHFPVDSGRGPGRGWEGVGRDAAVRDVAERWDLGVFIRLRDHTCVSEHVE